MPKEYTDIRDALAKSGEKYDAAQSEAAAIYNKRHPGHPLGSEGSRGSKKKKKPAQQNIGFSQIVGDKK